MILTNYDRDSAVAYAHKWAYARNPKFYNFEKIGGDCTNFASQCLYAGSGIMNFPGWYYYNINRRSPSWTGVEPLFKFLINNKGFGPFGEDSSIDKIMLGDIVQIKNIKEVFGHSPVVVEIGSPPTLNNVLVAAHTYDADFRPLSTYEWTSMRFIHILGVRKE